MAFEPLCLVHAQYCHVKPGLLARLPLADAGPLVLSSTRSNATTPASSANSVRQKNTLIIRLAEIRNHMLMLCLQGIVLNTGQPCPQEADWPLVDGIALFREPAVEAMVSCASMPPQGLIPH